MGVLTNDKEVIINRREEYLREVIDRVEKNRGIVDKIW